MLTMEAPKPFQLVAGHTALDLVNTLDNRFTKPEELLFRYEDVVRFTSEAGMLSSQLARRLKHSGREDISSLRVLKRVRDLREALSAVVYAMVDQADVPLASLFTLERYFKEAREQGVLRVGQDGIYWGWPAELDLSAPLWLLAQQAEDILLSGRVRMVRSCASDTCRWLFLDASKNHSRRWCDMKICGNRMKSRRFHARQAGG